MLDVCQHPHIRMREWGVEAITYLVKAALQYKYQPPLKDNQVSISTMRTSINNFSSVPKILIIIIYIMTKVKNNFTIKDVHVIL